MLCRLLVLAIGTAFPLAGDPSKAAREQTAGIAELETPAQMETPEFEAELHAWEADAMQPVPWEPLSPARVAAAHGSTLAVLEDHSIRAGGATPPSEICTVRIKEPLTGVTAFRLEVWSDESLRQSGPGRGADGNAVVTDFSVQIVPKENGHRVHAPPPPSAKRQPGGGTKVALTDATADFSAPGFGPALAIDADQSTGWSFAGSAGAAHVAVFQTVEPITVPPNTELVFSIAQSFGKGGTPGRFRISATTAAAPVRELDARIRAILALEPSEREPAQRETVANYFRTLHERRAGRPGTPNCVAHPAAEHDVAPLHLLATDPLIRCRCGTRF